MAIKVIKIGFQKNGDGTLQCVGGSNFKCLGQVGRKYPNDLTVQGKEGVDKWPTKYSNEFRVEMPWAVLIWGQVGIYIHGWPGEATVAAYGGDSNGCIHLRSDDTRDDAKSVYQWVDGSTRIVIDYPW